MALEETLSDGESDIVCVSDGDVLVESVVLSESDVLGDTICVLESVRGSLRDLDGVTVLECV